MTAILGHLAQIKHCQKADVTIKGKASRNHISNNFDIAAACSNCSNDIIAHHPTNNFKNSDNNFNNIRCFCTATFWGQRKQ